MQVNKQKPAVMLVLLIADSTLGGAGVRRATSQEQPREQPAQLRELAERLLARPFPSPGEQPRTAQLLPGQLPSNLPLDVPLPPGSRIVGSVVHSSGKGEHQTGAPEAQALQELVPGTESVIVLDTPGTAADVRAFYERELAARGWKAAPQGYPRPSGFQPAQVPFPHIFYIEGFAIPGTYQVVVNYTVPDSSSTGSSEFSLRSEAFSLP